MADSYQQYDARVDFFFDLQYSYNAYKGSMVDALNKLAAFLVIFFSIYSVIMICVRNRFYNELENEVVRVDEQVQMNEG